MGERVQESHLILAGLLGAQGSHVTCVSHLSMVFSQPTGVAQDA